MTKVTPLFSTARKAPNCGEFDCELVIKPPAKDEGHKAFLATLQSAGMSEDLTRLWFTYPNLREATTRLIDILSSDWPASSEMESSAVVCATAKALARVKQGVKGGEGAREFIVSNYLAGLGTVADDVVRLRAWGYVKERAVEQWNLEQGSFQKWASERAITEIRFVRNPQLNRSEITGIRMKLICAIATAKDVGAVTRFA